MHEEDFASALAGVIFIAISAPPAQAAQERKAFWMQCK